MGLCVGTPTGECGMGAIGRCVRDARPFCGKHRVEIGGANHCTHCAGQLAAERYARARSQWMERYESLPQGGVEELKALLVKDEYELGHRFDHLRVEEIEAVASRLLNEAGTPAKSRQSTIEHWHKAEPRNFPADWNPNPAAYPIADPRCLEKLWHARNVQVRLNRKDAEKRERQDAYKRDLSAYQRGTAIRVAILLAALTLIAVSIAVAVSTNQGAIGFGIPIGIVVAVAVLVSMVNRTEHKPIDPYGFQGVRGGTYD